MPGSSPSPAHLLSPLITIQEPGEVSTSWEAPSCDASKPKPAPSEAPQSAPASPAESVAGLSALVDQSWFVAPSPWKICLDRDIWYVYTSHTSYDNSVTLQLLLVQRVEDTEPGVKSYFHPLVSAPFIP